MLKLEKLKCNSISKSWL